MAIGDLLRLPRNAHRLAEILVVLVRHGFGPEIQPLNLVRQLPLAKRLLARQTHVTDKVLTTEERLTNAFQELGTTFVKFGQILSSRPDLVGESFAQAFRRLRDQVEPFDPALARRIIEKELKRPIGELFDSFDDRPGGGGSIAQVHRATLKDGREVMIKVRRPGIESAILADMDLLRTVARLLEPERPELCPTEIVEEFDRAIRSELDFTVEATSTARFHELLKDADGIRAPVVIWEYTTAAVLTVQRLDGISVGDVDELRRRGQDPRRIAKLLGRCFMDQYFRFGSFHADPHAGNILVGDDGTVGLIDFGLVGHLGTDLKAQVTTVLIAAVAEDIDFIAEAAVELGVTGEDFDPKQFRRDLSDLYYKYRGMPLGRMDTRRLFDDLTRVARHNDLALPRDLILLGKSMASITAVTRSLDPSYDVLAAAAPSTSDLIEEKISPARWAKHAGLNTLNILHLLRSIPRDLRSIVRKVETGQLQFALRHRGLERLMVELDRASNRLAISIYVAALLVASSLMMKVEFLQVRGVSVLGVLGYGLAGILSLWLAWGILRSGRL